MPFPYTVDQIVDAYRRRGVKAKACTWRQDETCMCPMSMLAVDKLAGEGSVAEGIKRFEEVDRDGTAFVVAHTVARIIGSEYDAVCAFVRGFDALVPKLFVYDAEQCAAYSLGKEARERIAAEGLFVN